MGKRAGSPAWLDYPDSDMTPGDVAPGPWVAPGAAQSSPIAASASGGAPVRLDPPRPEGRPRNRRRRRNLAVGAIALVVILCAAAALYTRRSSGPRSADTQMLNQIASRSLAASGFRVTAAGDGLYAGTRGVTDYQSPDRAHFVPAEPAEGIESIIIADTIYLIETNGHFIAYDQLNPRYFEALRFPLTAVAQAHNITREGDHYSFDLQEVGRATITVDGDYIATISYKLDKGDVEYAFADYGSTSVEVPDPATVDEFSAPKPCLPPGQQDPNVICVNPN